MSKKLNLDLENLYKKKNPLSYKHRFDNSIVGKVKFNSSETNKIFRYLQEKEWILQKDANNEKHSRPDRIVFQEKLETIQGLLIYLEANMEKKYEQ